MSSARSYSPLLGRSFGLVPSRAAAYEGGAGSTPTIARPSARLSPACDPGESLGFSEPPAETPEARPCSVVLAEEVVGKRLGRSHEKQQHIVSGRAVQVCEMSVMSVSVAVCDMVLVRMLPKSSTCVWVIDGEEGEQ